jgi:DNA-binding response OmpR family regulator
VAGLAASPAGEGLGASTARARILVVEDEAAMRTALAIALRSEGYEVQSEADGSAIKTVAGQFWPDLAILDVRLPVGPDGYAIARRLRGGGDLPLIFLTAADSYDARKAGFEAGADDYLVKPFAMEELLWRTRALLRRCGRISSRVRQIGDLSIDDGAQTVVRAGQYLALTRTEYRLMEVLAQEAGRVVSKEALLARVWGFPGYDTNLVEVHMSALRRKLDAHGPPLIHTVRGAGYVLRA